jgi:Subtilase family
MSENRRGEQLAAGCVAWLRRLWEWLLGLLGKGGAAEGDTPEPGITIENVIKRHAAPVDDPGPGNGLPRVALEVVRDDTATPSLIAAGEIVVRRDQLGDPAVGAIFAKGGFVPIETPGGVDDVCQFARFRSAGARGNVLIELVNDLRAAGVAAGGNWIMPFGGHITMKAGGGPERAPAGVNLVALESVAARHRRESGRPVTVAVIDTGVNRGGWADDFLEPVAEDDTNRDVLDVINAVSGKGGPDGFLDAGAGHGTFVCGLVRQFAPSAKVVVYRALDTDGIGHDEAISCAVARAVADVSGTETALVLNLSLGGFTDGDKPPVAIAHAVDAATAAGAVVVAAAGNEASPRPAWPAALPGVLAVSSLDGAGRPSTFGNFGWWIDFATVGEGAVSTFVAGRESPEFDVTPEDWSGQPEPVALWQGTSFAAPKLAAAVANLLMDGMSPEEAVTELRSRGTVLKGYGVALTDDLLP